MRRATERRARQLADTGLVDYRATAHGYLTFLAQLGEGPGGEFTEPPKVVKADELGLQVYWRAPNLSKQVIMGRRDTLLLPTDISYHRDHLGIVQNNFPSIIRLGDGDEVVDVPHPLSPVGLQAYDFAIADSLRIGAGGRTIDVLMVRVRPKDDRRPRVIGALYVERDEAQVVRMAFNFTRAAFRDRQLEDLFVILENGLIEGRFWLPRRQEIEIRRAATWMDFPARGIIRGRWEIGNYLINQGLSPALFAGPEIVHAPPVQLRKYRWEGRILDSLPPDVRAVTDADVRAVQDEARALVREQALRGTRSTALAARRISDFVRVNRVEGLAPGVGVTRRFGGGLAATLLARWATEEGTARGSLAAGWQRASGVGISLEASRDLRDTGIEPERSTLVNSVAAQEFGSDYTDPYDLWSLALALDLGTRLGVRWRLQGAWERHESVSVRYAPARGRFEPVVPALEARGWRASLFAERPTALSLFGTELRASAEARWRGLEAEGDAGTVQSLRLAGAVDVERPAGRQRLVLHTAAGLVRPIGGQVVAPQELVFLGGPVTGPGYEFHELAGRFGASQRVEWRLPVPFPAISLGRFGRSGGSATLAPFAQTAYLAQPLAVGAARAERGGWYPSVGVGSLLFFDVLRVDVARGLRDGRWTFSLDAGRDFWRVL
ncbi:MAG: hypothetical protein ACJ8AO_09785 [Gemmatimonadaceae bacterium]